MFVTRTASTEVLVVDSETLIAIGRLTAEFPPGEILMDDRESRLILAGHNRGRVQVLDIRSGTSSAQLLTCSPATGLAFQPFSRRVYVANGVCKEIVAAHIDRAIEMGSILLEAHPGLMTFDAEYRQLLVTLPAEGRLAVCSINTQQVLDFVEVGNRPYDVAVP